MQNETNNIVFGLHISLACVTKIGTAQKFCMG